MTQPVSEPTQARLDQGQEFRTRQLFRRPATGSGVACGEWQIPTLINGWSNAGSPFCDIAYRMCGDELEFMGHVTGGASGTIAFYLDSDFWPDCDMSTITDVIASPLGAAQIYVAAADGAVTITTII